MKIPFWVIRKHFDSYGDRTNEQQADLPLNGIRMTCPCCGYPTLGERSSYEICSLCNWEDDGQDDWDADEARGGPNQGYSLIEARLNFEKYLVMYPPDRDTRIGGADSESAREIKLKIIETFDEMLDHPPSHRLNILWKVIGDSEKALYREVKRVKKK